VEAARLEESWLVIVSRSMVTAFDATVLSDKTESVSTEKLVNS
jgi:hypothetical protein